MHGRGNYRGLPLGAVSPVVSTIQQGSALVPSATTSAQPSAPLPVEGECTADGQYIWHSGAWQRLAVGQACVTVGTYQGPATRTHVYPIMNVGPFQLPNRQIGEGSSATYFPSTIRFGDPSALTSDQVKFLKTVRCGKGTIENFPTFSPPFTYPNTQWAQPWTKLLGNGAPGIAFDCFWFPGIAPINQPAPVAKFKHPATGDDWGLWLSWEPLDAACAQAQNNTSQWESLKCDSKPMALAVYAMPIPHGFWIDLIGAIQSIGAAFSDVINGVASSVMDILKSVACDAAQAKATIAGLPKSQQAAGVAAYALLSQACPTPQPTTPIPPQASPWYLRWYTWLGAAAVVGAVVIARSHKHTQHALPHHATEGTTP